MIRFSRGLFCGVASRMNRLALQRLRRFVESPWAYHFFVFFSGCQPDTLLRTICPISRKIAKIKIFRQRFQWFFSRIFNFFRYFLIN